jgi:hypothetical protein
LRKKFIITPEITNGIIQDYQSGISITDIAKINKASHEKIRKILTDNNSFIENKSTKLAFEKVIGKKFGKLTALYPDIDRNNQLNDYRRSFVICKCDCGNNKLLSLSASNLLCKKTSSCGCLRYDNLNKINYQLSSIKTVSSDYSLIFPYEITIKLVIANCWYCNIVPSIKVNYFDREAYNKRKRSNQDHVNDNYESATVYRNGLDRVDPTIKEHTLGNLVPCCPACNVAKLDKPLKQFLLESYTRTNYIYNLNHSEEYIKLKTDEFAIKTNDFLIAQTLPNFASIEESNLILLNNKKHDS